MSGAKDVNGFIEEANKVAVSAKYGGWEKLLADYKLGNGTPEFYWDYYEMIDESGKDVALNKYLLSLPADKLISIDAGKLIERINLYDYNLYTRLVEERVKAGEKSAEFDYSFTFPLQWKFTHLINECINSNDKKKLDELLLLKNKLNVLPNSKDVDIELSSGRGLFFVSDDLVNLSFYYKNRFKSDNFVPLFIPYINRIISKYPISSLDEERAEIVKMAKGSPVALSFLSVSIFDRYSMFASDVLDWIAYYWRKVPSDQANREKCVEIANYIYNMNIYNEQSAVKAARLLVGLGAKEDAVNNLKKSVKELSLLPLEDTVKIKTLEEELQAIEEKKLL